MPLFKHVSVDVWCGLAHFYENHGETKLAEKLHILCIRQGHHLSYACLGKLYLAQTQYGKAIGFYKKANRMGLPVHDQLAHLYHYMGCYKESIEWSRKFITIHALEKCKACVICLNNYKTLINSYVCLKDYHAAMEVYIMSGFGLIDHVTNRGNFLAFIVPYINELRGALILRNPPEKLRHYMLTHRGIERADCPICMKPQQLYIYDCNMHSYCLPCLMTMSRYQCAECPTCRIPRHPYYADMFNV